MGAAPLLIGLTGNIATGKSTVATMLAELGAEVIDADRVAHGVMQPGTGAYAAVVEAFGRRVLQENGAVDRQALGEIVFSDPTALARLEGIVHPAVGVEVARRVTASRAPVVVLEAIKLLEAGYGERVAEVWVVTAPYAQQLARLVEQRGMDVDTARQRIQAQPPQAEKVARADVVIDNSGRIEQTRAQVQAAWGRLLRGSRKSGDEFSV